MSCDHDIKDCDCCKGDAPEPKLYNRPSLPSLRYRIGEYGQFYQRMIGKLHTRVLADSENNLVDTSLQDLTTRERDDHTIGLIDSWAVACDVLTFYQERIANEGFLRTATERRSILDLAAEIGYELSPGVAAETDLAFQVEEIKNQSEEAPITMPDYFSIPAGTQVQSMPQGSNELPQTFETLADFEARPAWNKISPLLGEDQSLASGTRDIWLQGISLNLKPGMRMLLVSGSWSQLMVIKNATVDGMNGLDSTHVELTEAVLPRPLTEGFGIAASRSMQAGMAYSNLDLLVERPVTGAHFNDLLRSNRWTELDARKYASIASVPAQPLSVHVFREKVGVYGNNAPAYTSDLGKSIGTDQDWDKFKWTIWKDFQSNTWYQLADIYLEREMDRVEVGSYVALETLPLSIPALVFTMGSAVSRSITGFAMSGKVTGLSLKKLDGQNLNDPVGPDVDQDKPETFTMRSTSVHLGSERVALARKPLAIALLKGSTHLALDTLVPGLFIDQVIILTGELSDTPGVFRGERHTIAKVDHVAARTTLILGEGLVHSYKRSSLRIMANVVRASHGERTKQVVGSGDGGSSHQQVTLNKPMLTHLVAPGTVTGRSAALTVRVDGVAWTQVRSLFQQPATDTVYTVRIDDDAKAHVSFGDGRMGARVPTGQINIEAEYRSGIGLAGEVGAATLTLLKSRPYGVKSVTNPIAADDAEDPETLDTARSIAPLTVRTMDRVVSLPDYEDFAAAFPAIGKTQAVELWNGHEELVHVTLLDTTGGCVSDMRLAELRQAIEHLRDPNRRFVCENGELITFDLSAEVLINPAYRWVDVEAALRNGLVQAFSYAQRNFGQPVSAAEVVEKMHAVKGVTAVDLNALGSATALSAILPSRIASCDKNSQLIRPAAMLLINTSGITLSPMTDET